jgi:uncharacterized delta-60 repeat protein
MQMMNSAKPPSNPPLPSAANALAQSASYQTLLTAPATRVASARLKTRTLRSSILTRALTGLLPLFSVLSAAQGAPGDLDNSFNNDGKVSKLFSYGSQAFGNAMALKNDGTVVVAGFLQHPIRQGSAALGRDFAVARFNADGTLDDSFGTLGKVTTSFGGSDNEANAVAIQANGKIVAAGFGPASPGNGGFALARYNLDGSLDSSFGGSGKVTTSFNSNGFAKAKAVAIQSDGKIVAAGFAADGRDHFALARYNINGSLDSSFGSGGRVTTDILVNGLARVNAIALEPDGKIVVAGVSDAANHRPVISLARYNVDGSLDPTFGVGGKVAAGFHDEKDHLANAIAIQADGKLVVAG